jgi:hypothetical protein
MWYMYDLNPMSLKPTGYQETVKKPLNNILHFGTKC